MSASSPNASTLEMPKETQESQSRIVAVIRDLMRLYGWSQQEVAERWGVSPAVVSKLLSGERQEVTHSTTQRFITAFRLDPRALYEVAEENGAS